MVAAAVAAAARDWITLGLRIFQDLVGGIGGCSDFFFVKPVQPAHPGFNT